jgi:ABC-type transport system involved in cytochrome bd biosynthesis fused ATPase/permease subunit
MNDKNTQPTFPSEREWKEFERYQRIRFWLGAFLGVVTAAMFAMLSWVALHNPNGSQFLIGMVYGVVMAIVVSLLPCAVSLLQGERVCS